MRVLILGIDGYLGWSLALHLAEQGYAVGGVDAFYRRSWVSEVDSTSALPIADMTDRWKSFSAKYKQVPWFRKGDITDYEFILGVIRQFEPDAIVHMGQCPSAPYSMMSVDHAAWVQHNNVIGTLNLIYAIKEVDPSIHLIKLGSMGEYGTPDLDIPEGSFEIEYRGRRDALSFPRQAGSWYHLSKVHDTHNIEFACKTFGLRATDIMQGVVYGLPKVDDPDLFTRLDFDECFGTVINRFCCQAVIRHPLTIYGKGKQQRGFLSLQDSMKCLTLTIENPPEQGEYRVFNQFAQTFSINELADKVASIGDHVQINHWPNPRVEQEAHYYNPDHQKLFDFGYQPDLDIDSELDFMIETLSPYRERISQYQHVLDPKTTWLEGGQT